MIEFDYKGERLKIYQPGVYGDGTPALHVVVKETGEPYATLTTCVAGSKPEKGAFLIKTWAENQALYEHLVKEKILEPTGKIVATGFVTAAYCWLHAK